MKWVLGIITVFLCLTFIWILWKAGAYLVILILILAIGICIWQTNKDRKMK